jgi:hypothetical protein
MHALGTGGVSGQVDALAPSVFIARRACPPARSDSCIICAGRSLYSYFFNVKR